MKSSSSQEFRLKKDSSSKITPIAIEEIIAWKNKRKLVISYTSK